MSSAAVARTESVGEEIMNKFSLLPLISTAALAVAPVNAANSAPVKQVTVNDPIPNRVSDRGVESTIRELEEQVVHAENMDDLSKLFASDIYFYNSYPGSVTGFSQLVTHMPELIPHVKNWKVDILEMNVIAQKDMAVAMSIQRWTSDSVQSGKPVMEQYYRQTDVWQKISGKWKIVHAHSSFPVDPKTEKVACMSESGICSLPNWPHEK
jgi:ketosteroid isomerase-like protein